MKRRGRRKRNLTSVAADDAGAEQSAEEKARFREYLQQYYYQLSRPTYGWLYRLLIWGVSYYGIRAWLIWEVIGVAPGGYGDMVMSYRGDAVAFLKLVAFVGAFLTTWFYFRCMRYYDWVRDEIIDEMFEPENAPRLKEAQKLAREQLDAELEAERLKEEFG